MMQSATLLLLGTIASSSVAWISPSQYRLHALCPRRCSTVLRHSLDKVGLNELHTLLRQAVAEQDFGQASDISSEMKSRLEGPGRLSWKALGAAPWLADRLDHCAYTFPTTIQINAMEAVNAMLTEDEESSLQERIDLLSKDMGVVVSGTTGSGKTLAYMVPLLSTLSDSLFVRQRLRVGAEENVVGDITEQRVAVVTAPEIRSNSRKKTRQPGAISIGAALSTLGMSDSTNITSPLALIVVPTRELGIQTAMLLYQLVGGSLSEGEGDESIGLRGAAANKYKGPKGIRIGCVLDDQESEFGLKLQTDVAITTPKFLGKLLRDDEVKPSKLRVVVYDEADLALEETTADDLSLLFDDPLDERLYARVVFLVGASVTESLGNLAVSSRVLPQGKSWIASATKFAELDSSADVQNPGEITGNRPKSASLEDLDVCLYPGLKHERVIVSEGTGLLILSRLLRKELMEYTQRESAGETQTQRPRVVVFFPDETQAKEAIAPLRDALWGEHKLCVLLPKTGFNPLTIMEQFKTNETTVMLATPNSVRGLDFPALTHVYTLYLPIEDPREYVHLAGRVGRIGQLGTVMGDGGHVVSVLTESEAGKMDDLARTLDFAFIDTEAKSYADFVRRDKEGEMDADSIDVEAARRYLEDSLTFLNPDELEIIDVDSRDDDDNIDTSL